MDAIDTGARSPRRAAALSAVLTLAGRAAAHGGSHADGGGHLYPGWLPPVAVLGGLVVLTGTLYADHRDALPDRAADAGVVAGALAVVLGVGTFVV